MTSELILSSISIKEEYKNIVLEYGEKFVFKNDIFENATSSLIEKHMTTNISEIDLTTAGEKIVEYKFFEGTDSEVVLYQTLNVVDNVKPTINLSSEKNIYIDIKNFSKLSIPTVVSVSDNCDDLDVSDVKIDTSTLLKKCGIYKISYSLCDKSGNKEEKVIEVTIGHIEFKTYNSDESNRSVLLITIQGFDLKEFTISTVSSINDDVYDRVVNKKINKVTIVLKHKYSNLKYVFTYTFEFGENVGLYFGQYDKNNKFQTSFYRTILGQQEMNAMEVLWQNWTSYITGVQQSYTKK